MKKLLLFLMLFCFAAANAQYQKPYFNTLSVQSGLPEANVRATLEDDNGYLWLGTQNGLVRYDGYQLKPYPMANDKGVTITPINIQYLFKDRKGKIWAYTNENGIYYYESQNDRFVSAFAGKKMPEAIKNFFILSWVEDRKDNIYWLMDYNLISFKLQLYKFNNNDHTFQEYSSTAGGNYHIPKTEFISINKDASGKVWMVCDSALTYYDDASQSFKSYAVIPGSLRDNKLWGLTPDPADADILWMSTDSSIYTLNNFVNAVYSFAGWHMLRFNIKTKKYQVYSANSKDANSLPANSHKGFVDSLKRFWLSTEKGISLFDPQQNKFINYNINFPGRNDFVSTIASDKDGNLWLGGNFRGLYYLNTKTGNTTLYNSNAEEGSLPLYTNIDRLFFDRSGTLWVGMPYFGIAYLNKQKSLFAVQDVILGKTSTVNNTGASKFSIAGSQGDSICFISDTSSLYTWHTQTNQFDKIDLKQKDVYQLAFTVSSIDNTNIWIGSSGGGLFYYNRKTRSVINYKNVPADSSSLSSNYINKIAVEKNGKVWIGFQNEGLCSFDPQTKRFTRYPFIQNDNTIKPVENKLDDSRVITLFFDKTGILWIGTNQGSLNRLNTRTGKFTSYMNNEQGFFCVVKIFEDSKKRLWVGTYLSGLFLFDRVTGKIIKKYTEQDGLLHNTVLDINEDAMGNIWCSSERGFSRIDPQTGKISGFAKLNKSFAGSHSGVIYKDAKGFFYLYLNSGMMRFNPAELKANPIPPSVIIESVSYHAAHTKTGIDTGLYTKANQKITLQYNENKIAFQFVALHFADAANNQYACQLVGYDKDWIQAGTQRTATYTNLSAGNYTFKVKASNSDGVWNETGASISITILPPWWKTWWAYLLYAVIFIIAISSFIAYRSAALKRENKVLEEKVELRTTQLQTSIADLKATQTQLIQSEKMASLGELTAGIAHEIQNPLNFVNNFSEVSNELIDEMKEELITGNYDDAKEIADDLKSNLEKINYHGKRADAIIKGMLQHSRSSSATKEPTDINKLADEYLRLAYHGLRAKDQSFNAILKTDYDETIGHINIIPQDIGRVILNLITNAFYAVNEKKKSGNEAYAPTVSITTRQLKDKMEVSITDNGNGIPQNIINKIFQPFFTTKPTGQGTGLGLSLAYDIIKAHSGELKVKTKEGESTEFIITLPAN